MMIANSDDVAGRQSDGVFDAYIVAKDAVSRCAVEKLACAARMNQNAAMATRYVARRQHNVVGSKTADRVESGAQRENKLAVEDEHEVRFHMFDEFRSDRRCVDARRVVGLMLLVIRFGSACAHDMGAGAPKTVSPFARQVNA